MSLTVSLTVGSPHATERFQFSHFHSFSMFILIIFTPLLTPLLFSKGFSPRQYSLHYFFDQQKTFGNYVQTILGRQYFDELNGTQSRIASHYVITRSYTLVQASDNPRQKCWDKIDIRERIQLSQRAYLPPLPQSMLHRMRCESSTLIRGAGFVPCTFV